MQNVNAARNAVGRTNKPCGTRQNLSLHDKRLRWRWGQPWDEKDAAAVEEEFSLEDLFGDDDDAPVKEEL